MSSSGLWNSSVPSTSFFLAGRWDLAFEIGGLRLSVFEIGGLRLSETSARLTFLFLPPSMTEEVGYGVEHHSLTAPPLNPTIRFALNIYLEEPIRLLH